MDDQFIEQVLQRAEELSGTSVLRTPAVGGEVVRCIENVTKRRPWQAVIATAFDAHNGGWLITTPLVTATWAGVAIPSWPAKAYVEKEGNGYIVKGLYGLDGCVYQRPETQG